MRIKILCLLLLANILQANSLKELIKIANKNNLVVESKKLLTQSKMKELESSKSSLLPTLDIGGFYQRLDDRTPMIAGDIYSGYAKISYNIYDGKRTSSTIKQKQNELKATTFEFKSFQKNLSLQIVQDFYMIKNISSTIKALKEKQIALKAQLDRVKKFYEAEISTKEDIDKIQSAYDTNVYMIESLNFKKLSKLKVLELKVGKPITILNDTKFQKKEILDFRIDDNIKALEYKMNSLKNIASSISSVNLPQINISDTYNVYDYKRDDITHPKGITNQNKLLLSVNLRVFDGGFTSENEQAMLIKAKSLNSQILQVKKEQKIMFDLAKSRIKTVKANIKSTLSALKSSNSTYETIQKKYKAGVVDNISYLDALSVKTDAFSLYEKSLNDLEVAYAIYYFYAGRNIEEFIK